MLNTPYIKQNKKVVSHTKDPENPEVVQLLLGERLLIYYSINLFFVSEKMSCNDLRQWAFLRHVGYFNKSTMVF